MVDSQMAAFNGGDRTYLMLVMVIVKPCLRCLDASITTTEVLRKVKTCDALAIHGNVSSKRSHLHHIHLPDSTALGNAVPPLLHKAGSACTSAECETGYDPTL